MISWPALRWALMISCLAALVENSGAWRPIYIPAALLSELDRSHRDRRALKIIDLARVEIDQPQAWGPLLGWSHSSDIRRNLSSRVLRLVSPACRLWRPLAGYG
jgi:hypothetical protein